MGIRQAIDMMLSGEASYPVFHSPQYLVFLKHLRQTREASGLTQKDVAQRLGKPASYVNKCHSGERRMDLVEIHDFCQAIGKPLKEFVQEYEALVRELPED